MKQSWSARKWVFLRVGQVEVGEQLPQRDREVAHRRDLDLAEPAHEPRQRVARDAVGEQEVDVLTQNCPKGGDAGFTVMDRQLAAIGAGMAWKTTWLVAGFRGRRAALRPPAQAQARRLRAVARQAPVARRARARWSRRMAALIPFYEFTGDAFFAADGAPAEVVAARKAGFERLVRAVRRALPEGRALTAGAARQRLRHALHRHATACRSSSVAPGAREPRGAGSFVQSSQRRHVTDLDGNRFYDLTGSYGVNLLRLRLLQGAASPRARDARARARPACSAPTIRSIADNVRAAEGDLRARRGLVPHVRHRGRDAGGAARALSHQAHASRALLRRLSRLVGRRAAGHRQSAAGRTRPTRSPTCREETLHVLRHAQRHRLRAGQPAAGAASERSARRRLRAGRSARRGAQFDREAYAAWLQQLREVCTERGIVLIFDEVFVGFRLAAGGAQEYFGVARRHGDLRQDARRRPAGRRACAAARDLMKRFRDDRPADICFARGTFNSHPYVMGAMDEFLRRLETPEVRALYDGLDETWNGRAAALNARLEPKPACRCGRQPRRRSGPSLHRAVALQLDAAVLPARRRPGAELDRHRPADLQPQLHRRGLRRGRRALRRRGREDGARRLVVADGGRPTRRIRRQILREMWQRSALRLIRMPGSVRSSPSYARPSARAASRRRRCSGRARHDARHDSVRTASGVLSSSVVAAARRVEAPGRSARRASAPAAP